MKLKILLATIALLGVVVGTQDAIAKKRCEKCERGPDGKMVCTEVPCPS